MHIYYREDFPSSTFRSLSLRLRALSGAGRLVVSPSHEGTTCQQTTVDVTTAWTQATLDVSQVCASQPTINTVTFQNPGGTMVLLLDDIVFAR